MASWEFFRVNHKNSIILDQAPRWKSRCQAPSPIPNAFESNAASGRRQRVYRRILYNKKIKVLLINAIKILCLQNEIRMKNVLRHKCYLI